MDLSLAALIKNKSWKKALQPEFQRDYFILLETFLNQETKKKKIIYPSNENIFNSINRVDIDQVKVVILGQDPYHGEGEAHGLSFSVQKGIKIPPSLRNIFKELETDLNIKNLVSGDLSRWADQGVLLLNTVLTVEKDKAHSHAKKGWEILTDKMISLVSENNDHVVFILWGKPAQQKVKLIDVGKHLIIESVHPSPLSSYRGFFGSRPFSKVNAWLTTQNKTPVNWSL